MPYQIVPASNAVAENAGTLQFTISRTASDQAETLFVSTTPDQGFSNSGDYQGLLNLTLNFAAGQASATINLVLTDDSLIEGNEAFGIIVQAAAEDPANVYLAKSTFTIMDNDAPATGTYAISTTTPVVDESAGTVTFTVTRSSALSAETLYVSTAPDQGSANSGDYQGLLNQAVSFATGETARTVTIKINDDAAAEGDERFGVIVQRNAADAANVFLARSDFTIRDNDQPEPPPPPTGPVLLGTYPASGIDLIAQGNRDNDDSHVPGTARQWSYDFLTPNFTDVHAVQGGTVVAVRQDFTAPMRGYGNVVTVLCDGGFYVTYAHLTAGSATVAVGGRVEAGQVIAKSGDSGSHDGTSLHPNLHVQVGSKAAMLNAEFGNNSTATLIADGSGDIEPVAYFPKLTIRFDQPSDPGLSTDTDYYGTRGIDDFFGNSYGNTVDGLAGNDILRGGGGSDRLNGGDGDDRLNGGDGDDRLDGGSGTDAMAGGKGNDTYLVDSSGDAVTEMAGEGTDTVRSSITYTLGANVESLVLTGSLAINGTGNGLDSKITGNAAANRLTGFGGADRLDGSGGADTVNGGAGSDALTGGPGRDALIGGTGADVFVFTALGDSSPSRASADVIADFGPGADRIDVSAIDARLATPGADDFTFVGTGAFTGDGQMRAVQSGSDTLLLFNTGGDRVAEMIVVLTGVKAALLTAVDFIA